MTALDLPAIRALLEGATPGEWVHESHATGIRGGGTYDFIVLPGVGIIAERHVAGTVADAAFIAAAPSIVAQLVAAAERVERLHRMMPGSHERAYGPECRCGKSWPCAEALNIRAAITGEGQA